MKYGPLEIGISSPSKIIMVSTIIKMLLNSNKFCKFTFNLNIILLVFYKNYFYFDTYWSFNELFIK